MMYDYLVVGCGLFGSVFAHLAKSEGKTVMVIDKRTYIGGNCASEDINGIQTHKFGPHIFHTDDEKLWKFVNSITKFNNFIYSPLADPGNGKLYNLPFNLNTYEQLWGTDDVEMVKAIIKSESVDIPQPKNVEELAMSTVGKTIYEMFIRSYTEKQWRKPCTEIPAEVLGRVPLRFEKNNNYFNDRYQGVPESYNGFFNSLLSGIPVMLGVDYFTDRMYFESIAEKIVYTGRLDEFYDNRFGRLDYRTHSWKTDVIESESYQGVCVVNCTDDRPWLRTIEHKYFNSERNFDFTVISREYPDGGDYPMYPSKDEKDISLFLKYKELADKETKYLFGGRLAEYKYLDMDDTIKSAFALYEKTHEI